MVRVLIAEDMRILRDTLVALLEFEDDLEVVAELDSGDHIVLAAHVSGFMVKDAPAEELVDAVRRVAAGERVIDQKLALAALEADGNPLSPREAEVLRHHAAGASAAEIAEAIHLSYGTVRNYLASAVTKLGARNRVDAARIAEEAGWL